MPVFLPVTEPWDLEREMERAPYEVKAWKLRDASRRRSALAHQELRTHVQFRLTPFGRLVQQFGRMMMVTMRECGR